MKNKTLYLVTTVTLLAFPSVNFAQSSSLAMNLGINSNSAMLKNNTTVILQANNKENSAIPVFFPAEPVKAKVSTQEENSDFRNKLSFGIKIGANYSNVYDSKSDRFNADPVFGFAAGGFIDIPIGKYFGLQPEVLFSQKGFKSTGVFLGSTYSLTRTTNYIDIPLLVAFKPSSSITLLAGPQYSYLMKQKDVFSNSVMTNQQETDFSNENLRKNTLCITGGLDLNFSNIVIGARAGWDLQNNNGDGTSTTPRYKNMWYQATIGFRF
jgi:hypothetical protein